MATKVDVASAIAAVKQIGLTLIDQTKASGAKAVQDLTAYLDASAPTLETLATQAAASADSSTWLAAISAEIEAGELAAVVEADAVEADFETNVKTALLAAVNTVILVAIKGAAATAIA